MRLEVNPMVFLGEISDLLTPDYPDLKLHMAEADYIIALADDIWYQIPWKL